MPFRSAFITGASSGLGRGLALHYARSGTVVHAAARRAPELKTLVDEAKGGAGSIVPVTLDVTDSGAVVAAIHAAEAASGGALDLVIANAGLAHVARAAKLDWEKVAAMCDVNVRAALVTVTAALPAMTARGSGTVVGISSLAGLRALPANSAYGATKVALAAFLEGLRIDLRGSGVRAITIYPGYVKTEMNANNRKPMPFVLELNAAVAIMSRGIDRGRPRIAYPWQSATAMRAASALPDWLWEQVVPGGGKRR